MKMSNKTYDILVYVAQIVLPALATLYFALASIWGDVIPYGTQIEGTIIAIDTFLGALLKLSKFRYDNNIPGDEDINDED